MLLQNSILCAALNRFAGNVFVILAREDDDRHAVCGQENLFKGGDTPAIREKQIEENCDYATLGQSRESRRRGPGPK